MTYRPMAGQPTVNEGGCDINLEATQLRGGIAFDPTSEIYRISGAGGDIGDTADRCFYVSQLVKGDCQITARLLDKPAKAGAIATSTFSDLGLGLLVPQ
jgi:hypothetical protein